MQTVTENAVIDQMLKSGEWHDVGSILDLLGSAAPSRRQVLRIIRNAVGRVVTSLEEVTGSRGHQLNPVVLPHLTNWLKSKRYLMTIAQITEAGFFVLSDPRGHLQVKFLKEPIQTRVLQDALNQFSIDMKIVPHGVVQDLLQNAKLNQNLEVLDVAHPPTEFSPSPHMQATTQKHPHLRELEQESIYIIREAVAAAERPAMLFSLGKDSMVMLRLAEKAFAPGPIPFPLVNIDTRWKFQEMNTFREWVKSRSDVQTIHFINPDAIEHDINPFDHGSAMHTDITKTQALKVVLNQYKFDFVFGGARRDEEKSRAKERIFSVRSAQHGWNPKNQRPELWDIYNTSLVDGQSMRVFPLSNWTELDIWRYLEIEDVPLVPLYFSKRRAFVERNGALIMVDDDRFKLEPDESVSFDFIRFRSLGCYPLSGGVRSKAKTVSDIVAELESVRVSERSSRVIDFDRGASMEQKKKEGYF